MSDDLTFKVGDKIRSKETTNGLTRGKIYEVLAVGSRKTMVMVKSDHNNITRNYMIRRFELVTPNGGNDNVFKPGVKLKCVYTKNSKGSDYPLTIGKIYECVDVSDNGTFIGIVVENDKGKKAKYKSKYFDFASQEVALEELWKLVL